MEKKKYSIKRGVSLYSFQEEYFLKQMTVEDMLKVLSELDVDGVEIIGEQMIPGYPDVPESFFDQWHEWMEKYNLEPVCLDMFLELNRFKGRELTKKEEEESFLNDIKFAKKLGCSIVRVVHSVTPELMARMAPYAEEYDMKLGLEVHAPFHFDHEYEQSLMETFEKVGSPYLGFVLDLGIYTKRFPRITSDQWIRNGMKPEIAQHIITAYNENRMDQIEKEVEKLGGSKDDINAASMAKYTVYTDPRRMLDYMKYVQYVHAKFLEMLPDLTPYSIPYDEIVPVLIEGGYQGYLSSEYEGNWVQQDIGTNDSVEQVRRHQLMLKQLLCEEE